MVNVVKRMVRIVILVNVVLNMVIVVPLVITVKQDVKENLAIAGKFGKFNVIYL